MLPVDLIASQLRSAGWCLVPAAWPQPLVAALRNDLLARRTELSPAGVGRGGERVATVRRDCTHWLDGGSAPQRELLAEMEALRQGLNRELLLGLFDFEAHYALYPAGGYYRRHRDAFRPADGIVRTGSNRILSTVHYLNDDWQPGDGGELVLWDSDDREVARLAPHAGTALFFLSEEFPHEVLPARRERLSVAGWFRTNGSTARLPDPPG